MRGTRPRGVVTIWSLGPGSYCATWVLCLAQPWVCDPNPCLALLLVLLHATAGIAALFGFGASPSWRRSLGAWLMLGYLVWWAAFGAIAFAWLGDRETQMPDWLPPLGYWTFRGTLVFAIASGLALAVARPCRLSASAPPPAPR